MLYGLESVTCYVHLGLYMCCKLFWMCIMPNPKKPNIHIQFVIHTPNPWAINFQWTKDYEPIGPQPVVHWKENLQSSLLIELNPKSISLNHSAITESQKKYTSINNHKTQPLSGSCLTTEWETKQYDTHSEQFPTHVKSQMNTASNTSQFI